MVSNHAPWAAWLPQHRVSIVALPDSGTASPTRIAPEPTGDGYLSATKGPGPGIESHPAFVVPRAGDRVLELFSHHL